MTTPIDERSRAIDDLYAVFAPDVVLEAKVEEVLARIVAIDCEARSTPVPASNESEGLREASEEEASVRLLAEWPGPNWSDVNSTVLLGYIRTLLATIDRLRAALAHAAPEGLDAIADDVRYAGGGGTSDYWRGFNDGIDKLVARLSQPDATEEAGR